MLSRVKAIQRILGALVGGLSLLQLGPLAVALSLGEDDAAVAFADTFVLCAVLGAALWFPVRRVNYEMRLRDGFFVTGATWIIACLVCAIPFTLAEPRLDYVQAVFESTSGITTTGATVIVGLDDLPRSVLLYRQFLNFIGGMGIVILAVAILPMLKIGGMQLFRAETTGPQKDSKLTPRIAETAKALWLVYLGLNTLCALAYWVAGMDLFDAVGHAMATISTAGFSTRDASFGAFDNPAVEMVAVVFMVAGAINFGLHWYAWRRATIGHYGGDSELRTFLRLVVGATVLVALALWWHGTFDGPIEALRHAMFQTVSSITTTGFATSGFAGWPSFVPLLLVMLSFVGGAAGSTTGGMKVARVVMVVRQGLREVKQLVHPKGQFLVKMGGKRVSESIVLSVSGFCTLYILTFLAMMLALTATGVDIVTAFGAMAACMNNLGPGLGEVAMHFRDMNDVGVAICSFAMVLGRLEVFTLLVLFTPAFWKE